MLAAIAQTKSEYLKADPQFGSKIETILTRSSFDRAEAEILTWSGYKPTPLISLDGLAYNIGVHDVQYKHEGPRFGLGSFKALGGAYAVLRVVQRFLSTQEGRHVPLDAITKGNFAHQISKITITSATDGNHGRSVAWGANRLGVKCKIYVHAQVSEYRCTVMENLGAKVERVDGDYDETVEKTRLDAEKNGWTIVSDTSWPGYTETPLDVMAGYGVMAREIVRELRQPPTHVFLQGGVGGMAAAVIADFYQEWGVNAPRNIVVEPELAPCLFTSAKKNILTTVKIEEETLMAGLSCGKPSTLAWEVLRTSVHGFMTIPENMVAATVRMLAKGQNGDITIEAGESAVAGLIGLIYGTANPSFRNLMELDSQSRVLIIGSEGITDPTVFERIMSERV